MAKLSGGESFMQDVIRMQFLGRMDGSEGSSGALYYFTSSQGNYALAYPVALVVLYCAAAGLLVMLGLSIPQAKKARYVLPILPMAAIIAAYPFQVAGGRLFAWLRGLMLGLWILLPGQLIVVLVFARPRYPQQLSQLGRCSPCSGCCRSCIAGVGQGSDTAGRRPKVPFLPWRVPSVHSGHCAYAKRAASDTVGSASTSDFGPSRWNGNALEYRAGEKTWRATCRR